MNFSTSIFLVDDSVRAVAGTYDTDGKTCIFKTRDKMIRVGDIVVVPSGTRHNFTTFKITEVDVPVDYDQAAKMEWVVSRVDMEEYKKTIDHETSVVQVVKSAEQRKRRDELKAAIFADQSELAKLTLYSET